MSPYLRFVRLFYVSIIEIVHLFFTFFTSFVSLYHGKTVNFDVVFFIFRHVKMYLLLDVVFLHLTTSQHDRYSFYKVIATAPSLGHEFGRYFVVISIWQEFYYFFVGQVFVNLPRSWVPKRCHHDVKYFAST